jgi:hypothetical protein
MHFQPTAAIPSGNYPAGLLVSEVMAKACEKT